MTFSCRGFLAFTVGCVVMYAAVTHSWVAMAVAVVLGGWLVLAEEVEL